MNNRLGLLAMAALVGLCLPGAVRADRMDTQLHGEMPAIVQTLQDAGFKNVGVLRFRVQVGNQKPDFTTPMSGVLATSVRNFLIIHGGPEEKEALAVLQDPGLVAQKQKVGAWYRNTAGRRKLFTYNYPLAWGKKTVKPDVFVTGLVKVAKDLKKTTVTLEYFTRKSPAELVELKTFTIKSDRDILRNLGYSFALSQKTVKRLATRGPTDSDVDDELFAQVRKPEKQPEKQPNDKQPEFTSDDDARPSSVGSVEVQMLVDGKAETFRPARGMGRIKWQVTSPPVGKVITFRLKNHSAETRGVALRLNGVNTVNEQKDEPDRCQKWVLDPGESVIIRGFTILPEAKSRPRSGKGEEDESVTEDKEEKAKVVIYPFKVLVGSEASLASADMGEKAGLIEVDVFAVGTVQAEAKISGRGLPPSKEKLARESYVRLRNDLIRCARLKTTRVEKREVIVADPKAALPVPMKGFKLVSFDKPQVIAHVAIKVIPREPTAE
jgi:hypothetical protein